MISSMFLQLASASQLHSSVQTRLFCLHEHLHEHLLVDSSFVAPQLQRMSWRTASGAGASFVSNGNNLSSCICHPSVTGSGMTGYITRSCNQTHAWTCARRICSNQAPGVGGSLITPWLSLRCLKRCYRRLFAVDILSCLGQNSEHKNSLHPLITSRDGSPPCPSLVSASSTVESASRKALKHPFFTCSLYMSSCVAPGQCVPVN